MSIFGRDVIDERTIILWVALSAAATGACLLVGSVIVLLTKGCWPLARIPNACLQSVEPDWLAFVPIALGIVFGTALTIGRARAD